MATVLIEQSSLLTLRSIQYHLFCFSPHTTHLLQPLDVVVFQRLSTTMVRRSSKRHNLAAPISAESNSCMNFILSENRPSKKKYTIFSAFRKTGLLPFAPGIVLEELRELEAPTRPTTPSSAQVSPKHHYYPVFKAPSQLIGGDYCKSIIYYSAEA